MALEDQRDWIMFLAGEADLQGAEFTQDIDQADEPRSTIVWPYAAVTEQLGFVAAPDHIGVATLIDDFGRDFIYDRVWDSEDQDFGFIQETDTRDAHIWNAYLTRSIQITAIADPGHDGISISNTTVPITLLPNEETLHVVTVTPEGPAEQDTTYTFTVDGEDRDIRFRGQRLVLFPFLPNWKQGVNYRLGYETVIATGRNMMEQRRAQLSLPKRGVKAQFTERGVVAEKMLNAIRFGQVRYAAVPIYHEVFYSDSTITGQTVISSAVSLDYLYNLQALCSKIIFIDPINNVAEVKDVDSISGTDITLTAAVEETFDPTYTLIMPCCVGILQNHSMKYGTDDFSTFGLEFDEVYFGVSISTPPTIPATMQTLPDYIVPDFRQGVNRSVSKQRELIQFFGSTATLNSLHDKRPEMFSFADLLDNRERIGGLTQFFCEHRGRLARFYLRLPINEFTLVGSYGPGVNIFDIQRNGYHLNWRTDDRVLVITNTGNTYFRSVTDVVEDDLNDEITITLDSSIAEALDPDIVVFFGRVYVTRFDIDILRLDFVTPEVGKVSLRFLELEEDPTT